MLIIDTSAGKITTFCSTTFSVIFQFFRRYQLPVLHNYLFQQLRFTFFYFFSQTLDLSRLLPTTQLHFFYFFYYVVEMSTRIKIKICLRARLCIQTLFFGRLSSHETMGIANQIGPTRNIMVRLGWSNNRLSQLGVWVCQEKHHIIWFSFLKRHWSFWGGNVGGSKNRLVQLGGSTNRLPQQPG